MNRGTLVSLQILVAVVCIAVWHVLAKYPICGLSYLGRENDCMTVLPPFFFSTPLDVAVARREVVRARARSGGICGSRWSRRCSPS